MRILAVETRRELQAFIDLPYRLYRDDPNWVAPLRSEQASQYIPARNPMLDHYTYQLFMLEDNGQFTGRISAFTDSLALEHWQQPIGLFGSFEASSAQGASLLLQAAQDWLAARGMQTMRGPWSFASQEWGTVVEGFSPPPVILAPYNPPVYNDYLTGFGLEKAKDLLVYYMDTRENYAIPERILTLTELVQKRYGVRIRPVNMQNLEEDVITMVLLANQTISDNWGFYPVTEAEGRTMARDLKQIVNPDALLIAEDPSGRAIGFAMALPDVNQVLRGMDGRLLPFGWLKMLTGLPKVRDYRMWALGVIPDYHGKAIDSLLYRKVYENLIGRIQRLEINYILEDNYPMNNAVVKLGAKLCRRYRVYEKRISA